ncbi:MAG TPA: fibronectin type III domain-containing protein [Vicinamibacterales bacterium]|nr:fibronectin type III domain-containing protein [Vicinamibacterales bacterium]
MRTGSVSNEITLNVPDTAGGPGPPLNLRGTFLNGTLTLAWDAPATGTPAGYLATASVSTAGGPEQTVSSGVLPPNTALSVSGLPAGTYRITLRAVRADGTAGASSNLVTIVVP